MSVTLPGVHESFEAAQVQHLMKETEHLWNHPSNYGFHRFDRTLARNILDFFFADPCLELDLNGTFVGRVEGRIAEIRLLVQYTDEDDGTGVTRWFVYAPNEKRPGFWKRIESDED